MTPSKNAPPSAACSSALKLTGTLLCLTLSSLAWGQAAVVTHLSGALVAQQVDGKSRLLSVKSEVQPGETLVTQDNTYARLKFQDGAEVVLRPNSQLAVKEYVFKPEEPKQDNQAISLLKGGLRMVTGFLGKRNPDRVNVTTATATIGIRGTHFGLLMCQNDCASIPTISGQPPADGLHIDVADGAIQVSNPVGRQIIGAGQFGFVGSLQSPPTIVPPGQGIQVTMPPQISQNNAAGKTIGSSRQNAECAVQ